MDGKISFETRITAIVLFLTVMLAMEGAYPMWKANEVGFFYWCLAASLIVSLSSITFCLWRQAQNERGESATCDSSTSSTERTDEGITWERPFAYVGTGIYLGLIGIGLIFIVMGYLLMVALLSNGNYIGLSLAGVGIALIALGWNLLVTQSNQQRSAILLKNIEDLKTQLNRIENNLHP